MIGKRIFYFFMMITFLAMGYLTTALHNGASRKPSAININLEQGYSVYKDVSRIKNGKKPEYYEMLDADYKREGSVCYWERNTHNPNIIHQFVVIKIKDYGLVGKELPDVRAPGYKYWTWEIENIDERGMITWKLVESKLSQILCLVFIFGCFLAGMIFLVFTIWPQMLNYFPMTTTNSPR